MKYLMAIMMSTFFLATGFAQKKDFTKVQDVDPEAQKVLEKVSKKYEAYKSIEATFSLEIEIPEEPVDKQTGKLKQQGEKYNVDLSSYSMICDGESFWVHNKQNKEVQLNDPPEEDDEEMMAPQDFYSFYKKGKYLYALTNAIVEKGVPLLQIEFKPLEADSEYSKIRMTIEKKTSAVKRIKVFSKDGSRFTLEIEDFKANKKYTKADFTFDKKKFPDVHIEDLRF
ncbi:MAG: outer membrane lipoprotein carrier protein LolA [Saprospiraceae bacterium]